LLLWLSIAIALGGRSAWASPDEQSGCSLQVKRGDGYALLALSGFDPSDSSRPLGPLPPETNAVAVLCRRATIVPELADYRVLDRMHLPLALTDGKRVLWLVIVNGQLAVYFPEGKATPEELPVLQQRVDQMQTALQATKRKPDN